MKKKGRILIICGAILLILLCVGGVLFFTMNRGDLKFSVSGGEVTVVRCKKSATEVEIPEEVKGTPVTRIEAEAFADCENMTSITLPKTVTVIGKDAFSGCSALKTVDIPDLAAWCAVTLENEKASPTNRGAELFSNGKKITKLKIPDGVTDIGYAAFYGCKKITDVTIPESVKTVNPYAFYGCKKLETVHISDLAAWCGIEFGENAANPLESGAVLELDGNRLTGALVIPDGVTEIGSCAFIGCNAFSEVTIPETVTKIGNKAFYGCDGIRALHIADVGAWCETEFGEEGANPLGNGAQLYIGDTLAERITVPDSVKHIADRAFSGCSSIEKVIISDSATTVGKDAFADCIRLSDIYYPGDEDEWNRNSVSVAAQVHYDYVPPEFEWEISGSTLIIRGTGNIPDCGHGEYASAPWFDRYFDSVIIEPGIKRIGEGAFCWNRDLVNISIPDTVESIGDYAFDDCENLESITIPDTVESIGDYAFNYCENLESITIPDSVASIGVYAFSDCFSLESITMPKSVTSIGWGAFLGTAWYENQPDGLIYIGKVLYKYKGDMAYGTEITVRDGTSSIADEAFEGCERLSSVVIPESVTEIGFSAFNDCKNLESIVIPNAVTQICFDTFSGCEKLESIVIPDSVTEIGSEAFSGTKWYENQPDGLVYINNILYKYKGDMPEDTEIMVRDGTSSVTSRAFYKCYNLKKITMPDSVASIGSEAFYGCENLESVIIPDSVTSIGSYTFYGCENLESVIIPSSVESIGQNAFCYCENLKSITIPSSITSIAMGMFISCSNLESVTIPVSLTKIGDYAFEDCYSLTDIYYGGTAEQWERISIGVESGLYDVTIHYNT